MPFAAPSHPDSKSPTFAPPSNPPPPTWASSSRPPPQSHPSDDAPPPFAALPDEPDLDIPPPAFLALHYNSPTSNAPEELANAGWEFTDANPLSLPLHLPSHALSILQAGTISLAPPPPRFTGLITSPHPGIAALATAPGCPDTTLLSGLPLYAAGYHHPLNTGVTHRAYFELSVQSMPANSALAIGFSAVPYPPFRLPGWNRGSVGVHGDDGRRYVNDSYGGRDFVQPWREGQVVGLEMTWGVRVGGGVDVEVAFWRDGVREGAWRLDEERDGAEENDPVMGLGGGWDVYAAIGVWGGGVKATVKFEPGPAVAGKKGLGGWMR
ncbi:hypothetical protein EDC01DRAFT_619483 [Geopyxis carbonaria]|nr:hypothetical protein EDC01DRAFT_619483 [Geopyxis carbonaria]